MNSFMKMGIWIFVGLIVLSSCTNCSKKSRYGDKYDVSIQQTIAADAASGLNLQAVGELVKEVKDAPEFEKMLNDSSKGVNNLDLDEDGKVDYIKVTEYGSGNVKGFSLTVDLADNQTQEVATIEIEKSSDGYANVQTYGNSNLYGNNHYYQSRVSLTDVLLVSWLFSGNRPFYSSPWGYNSYPGYYNSYSTRNYDTYNRYMQNSNRGSTFSKSNTSTVKSSTPSPNANKSASNIKAPLKNPTNSQKSFQARNPSKKVKSGGFGKPKSSSSPNVRSSRSSSYRGGGK